MTERPSGDGIGRFMGLLLMGAAILWIAFCGLCALGVGATVVTESATASDTLSSAFFVLLITGLGAAAGYAVFVAGRSLWR